MIKSAVAIQEYVRQVKSDRPTFYYPLWDGGGSQFVDQSGSGLSGALTLATAQEKGPFPNGASLSCLFTQSGGNGTSYAEATGVADLTTNWTIEAWINYTSIASTSGGIIYARWNNTIAGRQLYFYINATTKKLQVDVPFIAAILSGNTALVAGTWYHVALTRSGNTWTTYINGVADATTSNAAAQESYGTIRLGAASTSPSDNYMLGYQAHTAGYPSALSISRIQAHYLAGVGKLGTRRRIPLTAAFITATTPGCSKIADCPDEIHWTQAGITSVDVTLSIDGGSTFPYTLASGVTAAQGFARFWCKIDYVSNNCVIKVQGTGGQSGYSSTTSAFAIVANTSSALQPAMTAGAGSSAISSSGSGASPSYGWAASKGETWTGVRAFGVVAACPRSDNASASAPSMGIEKVTMRANGGAWVDIHQISLNTVGTRAVQWTPPATPFFSALVPGTSYASGLVRDSQEYCATLDASGLANNTTVTLQARIHTYEGRIVALPDLLVVANPTGLTTYYVSASGNSGNAGTRISPLDTIQNAVAKAVTNSVTNGLTIVMLDGSHKVQYPSTVVDPLIPITITPDTGAWSTAKLIGVVFTGSEYWQVKNTRLLDCKVDMTDATGIIAVTNQAGIFRFDGNEIYANGPGSNGGAALNGFTGGIHMTECYIHDQGDNGGGQQWATRGTRIRNVLNYNCGGIQGSDTTVVSNYTVQNLQQLNLQHSDILTPNSSGAVQVAFGLIAINCFRPIGLLTSGSFTFAYVNCDTDVGSTGSAATGNSIGGQNVMLAYCRTGHNTEYIDHNGPNSNQQFTGNIFDLGITATNPTNEAAWYGNDYGSGSTVATDATATSGSTLTYSNRMPVAGNTSFNCGLPITPYDALNRRRGYRDAAHTTSRGAFAQATEYSASASGQNRLSLSISIGI